MTSNKNIRIVIQKHGRLEDPSLDFIESLGLKFDKSQLGNLIIQCTNAPIELLFVRNSDIPEYIKNGVADFGIVGENVIYERGEKYKVLKKLGFGRCQLVVAVPEESIIKKISDLQSERVATSYPNSLKTFLKQNNVNASIIIINGSVEIAPELNLADAICDITQTGNTLKKHDLKPIATILESEALLIESQFNNEKKQLFLSYLNSYNQKNMEEKNKNISSGMMNNIIKVFSQIDGKQFLEIAKIIKEKINKDPSLIEIKSKKDYVTQADIQIQQTILDFFANSSLKGTYKIKAEEELTPKQKNANQGEKKWQLLIDPLDGTGAFCKSSDNWGVMIGACDLNGQLIYSWNMVSTGEIYQTSSEVKSRQSFSKKIANGESIAIDVYDYGAGASEKFGSIFEIQSGYTKNQYNQTSYPAAIWAGWQLYQEKLDGMLWLPSTEGKKNYPDYDLIFLGALRQKGYQIRLGKIGDSIEMIAIAPTREDLEVLWKTGLEMVPFGKKDILESSDGEPVITTSLI